MMRNMNPILVYAVYWFSMCCIALKLKINLIILFSTVAVLDELSINHILFHFKSVFSMSLPSRNQGVKIVLF